MGRICFGKIIAVSLSMRIFLVLFIILLGLNKSHGQLFSFDLWKLKKEWGIINFEKANTARFSPYMLWSQKRIILYFNLARQDGEKFMELVVDPFFEKHPELASEKLHPLPMLQKAKKLNMLYPSFRVWLGAFPHAVYSGFLGMEGHQGFEARMKLFLNSDYIGENCFYGYFNPLKTALGWMNSSGHCSNIVNKDFSRVGVAKMPHIGYRWNTVNTFSGPKFFDIMIRNHSDLRSFQFNVSTTTDIQNFILDISVGQRKNKNLNAARWSVGSELFPFRKESLIGYKLHWASEYQYGAMGANAIVYLTEDDFYPILRPELSARYEIGNYKSVVDFDKKSGQPMQQRNFNVTQSSISLSYGYNFLLQRDKEIPVGKHVISITYSRNFLFKSQKRP
jgi:hypothetical protein